MSDEYKQQVMGHINETLKGDIMHSPNYQTMVLIRDKLVAHGFERDFASDIVTRIQVMVADEIYADVGFMHEVTTGFANVINEMHRFSEAKFKTRQAFINLVDGMTLTLVP